MINIKDWVNLINNHWMEQIILDYVKMSVNRNLLLNASEAFQKFPNLKFSNGT